jgi:hypothetical protein
LDVDVARQFSEEGNFAQQKQDYTQENDREADRD